MHSAIGPQVGDKIMVDRGIYKHFGIFIGHQQTGGNSVVHNDKVSGAVVACSLFEFSGGLPVHVEERAIGTYFERQAIVQRAVQLIGTRFDLFNFNCEHMANLALRGVAESLQVQGAVVLLALVCGLFFLSRKG